MSDDYMTQQCEALAQHLRLTDGKSGNVEATADGFHVHARKKVPIRREPPVLRGDVR